MSQDSFVALGVSAKLNALWAPVAIATWLWVIERRLAAVFAVYAAISCVALLGTLNVVSDGRMLENLVATSGAGVQGAVGFLKAPARMLGPALQCRQRESRTRKSERSAA